MAEPIPLGGRIRSFEDLTSADDDFLRQLAARVHIIDLAYAFATADEALRARLLGAVKPGLASQIESAIRTVMAQSRPTGAENPPPEQVRSARARVMEVAHGALLFESEKRT